MFSLRTSGKYRKHKSFGLVGCVGLALVAGGYVLANPATSVSADVIRGGDDIENLDVHSKAAEGVAMTYTTFDSGSSGKQTASGSGVFVAPNVMVTVAHNYYDKNPEDKSAVLRGGSSARSYVVSNSETEKSNKVPTSGATESIEKGSIHAYNEKEFGRSYENDLALVVTKKPVEALTNGEDSPRDLGDTKVSVGDKINIAGYPNDFSTTNLSATNRERLKDGKAYSISTTVSQYNPTDGSVVYHSSALGGFSGAPIFNEKGEVIGIHQHGTNGSGAAESNRIGGGLIFTEKQKAWIRSMIEKYAITGWYVDGNKRYYYDENHIALRDVEKEIDGVLYSFDSKGLGTVVKGSEKGRVILRIEDSKGNRVISDKVLQTGEVGSLLEFHLRQNSEFKDLLTKSPTSKVVSYGGVSVNKPITDSSWSDEYVSKLALGDTVIKLVVDQVTESAKPKPRTEPTESKPKADFSRTEVGSVNTSGSSKLPKPSEEVRNAPNGVENFGASAYIQTPDGTGSGTLIAPDLLLTVAHNFLKAKGSEVVTKSGKTNTVYSATFPKGKSITFSDEDISYWNKKDSVFGFKHDLAVIRLKEKVEGITPADLVSSSVVPKEGDFVSVYGYPDGKLKPVLDSKVVGISDFGSGIRAISYSGTKPGASGGGLYDDKGTLIGVHQNGVEGSRSGGLVLSKEQLDWVRSYVDGTPKAPVYVEGVVSVDEKDKLKEDKKEEVVAPKETPKAEETPKVDEKNKEEPKTSLNTSEELKIEVVTKYKGDNTLEVGKEHTEETTAISEGVKKVTRTVVKGTLPKVEITSVTPKVVYKADETKPVGFREETKGTEGYLKRTIYYIVDEQTGLVSEKVSEEKVEGKDTVIRVGLKSDVSETRIAITERLVPSTELEKGKREVISEGAEGLETTTVTYKLTDQGVVVEGSRKIDTIPMKERLVRVGIKEVVVSSSPKLETFVPKDAPSRSAFIEFVGGVSDSEPLVQEELPTFDLASLNDTSSNQSSDLKETSKVSTTTNHSENGVSKSDKFTTKESESDSTLPKTIGVDSSSLVGIGLALLSLSLVSLGYRKEEK